jgi:hypothetical protein
MKRINVCSFSYLAILLFLSILFSSFHALAVAPEKVIFLDRKGQAIGEPWKVTSHEFLWKKEIMGVWLGSKLVHGLQFCLKIERGKLKKEISLSLSKKMKPDNSRLNIDSDYRSGFPKFAIEKYLPKTVYVVLSLEYKLGDGRNHYITTEYERLGELIHNYSDDNVYYYPSYAWGGNNFAKRFGKAHKVLAGLNKEPLSENPLFLLQIPVQWKMVLQDKFTLKDSKREVQSGSYWLLGKEILLDFRETATIWSTGCGETHRTYYGRAVPTANFTLTHKYFRGRWPFRNDKLKLSYASKDKKAVLWPGVDKSQLEEKIRYIRSPLYVGKDGKMIIFGDSAPGTRSGFQFRGSFKAPNRIEGTALHVFDTEDGVKEMTIPFVMTPSKFETEEDKQLVK